MQRTAEKVLNSIALLAIARVVVPIGIGIILALLSWTGLRMVNLGERVALVENIQAADRSDVIRRLNNLEAHDTADNAGNAKIVSDIAALKATSDATLHAVDRIERALDARPLQRQ